MPIPSGRVTSNPINRTYCPPVIEELDILTTSLGKYEANAGVIFVYSSGIKLDEVRIVIHCEALPLGRISFPLIENEVNGSIRSTSPGIAEFSAVCKSSVGFI